MHDKVRQTIREHRLFTPEDRVLVAVSGGVDSLSLAHLLHERKLAKVVIAHVDHGLRGEESVTDRLFVERFAAERGIECYAESFDAAAHAKERGLSIQVAAREIRYGYLKKAAGQAGAAVIATAHHADDQAETVLMRVLRGTSVRGLGGIAPRREEQGFVYVRPLLHAFKREIKAYAEEAGLLHREDSSNASTKYLRNKIRIRLLPELVRDYNPGVKSALVQLAELAREDESYLESLSREAYERVKEEEAAGRIVVGAESLAVTALPLQRRVITLILYYLCGHTNQWEQVHVESVRSLLTSKSPSAELSLPAGVLVRREYGRLLFEVAPDHAQPTASPLEPISLSSPGVYRLPDLNLQVELEVVDGAPPRPRDSWEAHFDADELSGSCIYIRTWARGDAIRPLGMHGGRKLISDVLGEAKVPKQDRTGWPLLVVGGEIAWVLGIRRSLLAPITAKTRRTLVVRATRLS